MPSHAGRPLARLSGVGRAVRRRYALIVALRLLPVGAALFALIYAFVGTTAACLAGALPVIAVWIYLTLQGARRYDIPWVMRRLNAALPAFEDSIELVLDDAPTARPRTALQRLQGARMQRRLQTVSLPDLRPAYPWRSVATVAAAAAIVIAAAPRAPMAWAYWQTLDAHQAAAARSSFPAAMDTTLLVQPPAYTKLPSRRVASPDARVPAGSEVAFNVQLAAESTTNATPAPALQFDDGATLPLHRDGDVWRAQRVLEKSTLYRLQVGAASPALPWHRLDAIPDHPPQITVRTPERSLTPASPGQKNWDLEFEATDDYGLTAADLVVTLAQGSGENIKSSSQTLRLAGRGDERHQTYRKSLDLAALGFAQGDDLIVRLSVSDNHPPAPNQTQSASFILRWDAPAQAASEGMEGVVQKTLPAYFSSERQLIIDTEALIAARGSIDPKRFAAKADDLGVQQKVLRLRYGQFLGEEFESNAEHAPPGQAATQGSAALKDVPPESSAPVKTRDLSKGVGDAAGITGEFGHVHDKPEAATLLDPDTRRILKLALDEMWQAELQLRLAQLDNALPYEYKALEYIKQVQQADRIYLARAGTQLPQVDLSRRLSGERAGLTDRDGALPTAPPNGTPIAQLWQTLQAGGSPDWEKLAGWTRQHRDEVPDALGLLMATDRAQHDPLCQDCRAEVERLLWPLLPQPAGAPRPRAQADAAGAAYVDALSSPGAAP